MPKEIVIKIIISGPNIRRVLAISLLVLTLAFLGRDGVFATRAAFLIQSGDEFHELDQYQEALEKYDLANALWQKTVVVKMISASPVDWRLGRALAMIDDPDSQMTPEYSELLSTPWVKYLVTIPEDPQGSSGKTSTYSPAACESQKKSTIGEVDQAYLTWYEDWQDARKELSNCYESNPVPVCDKQMSDLNVWWQNKITKIIDGYKDSLTKCREGDKDLSPYSSVLSGY